MQRRTVLKHLGLAAAAQLSSTALLAQPLPADDGAVGPDAFFDQVGYRPGDAKVATIRGAARGQTTFRVRRAEDNKVLFEGPLTAPQTDAASGMLCSKLSSPVYARRAATGWSLAGRGHFRSQ